MQDPKLKTQKYAAEDKQGLLARALVGGMMIQCRLKGRIRKELEGNKRMCATGAGTK